MLAAAYFKPAAKRVAATGRSAAKPMDLRSRIKNAAGFAAAGSATADAGLPLQWRRLSLFRQYCVSPPLLARQMHVIDACHRCMK